jgi:hypothetical protein
MPVLLSLPSPSMMLNFVGGVHNPHPSSLPLVSFSILNIIIFLSLLSNNQGFQSSLHYICWCAAEWEMVEGRQISPSK